MHEISSNKTVVIAFKNQTFDVTKLKMGVEFSGRTYVIGLDAAGKHMDLGTLNDLVKTLSKSPIDIEHRKVLHNQIKLLEKSLETDIKPRMGTRTPTALGFAIRNFTDNLLFNRQEHLKKFEAEVASAKPKRPEAPARPKTEVPAPKPQVAQAGGVSKPAAAGPTSSATFNHQKTPVAKLQQNVINPFRMDHEGRTPKEQFEEIEAYIKEFQKEHPGKQLAITYAANTGQANALYKGYANGTTPQIKGSNQAEVFALLTKKIKDAGWDNSVHILPIPTIEYSFFGIRKIAKMEDVEKAMDNVETHMNKADCFVLGYQNKSSDSPKKPLAIGGGVAEKVSWTGSKQQEYVHERANKWMAPKEP